MNTLEMNIYINQICMDEDVMSSVSIFSVESLSLVQPFNVQFISKYFVKVNLQLYLAPASPSLFSFIWIISYCPNVWIFLLTCKFDVFCNYTIDYEALRMPSFLFLHHPRSILLSSFKFFTWKFKFMVVASWLSRFWCRCVWWFNSLSRLQAHEIKDFGYLSRCICRWFKRRPDLEILQ